jgi:signal transduction histidine kinase
VLFRGLKSKLIFNLALVLFLAVLLTDFIVIRIVERNLIQKRLSYGKQVMVDVAGLVSKDTDGGFSLRHGSSAALTEAIGSPFLVHGLFSGPEKPVYRFGRIPPEMDFDLKDANLLAAEKGATKHRFFAETWGVFWKQNRYVSITSPFPEYSRVRAATITLRIDDIYQSLRASQKLIIFYSIANLLLLICLGLMRLNRIVLRPIQRFIQLTEHLQSSEHFPSYPEKRSSEFNRLSNAIQQMAKRIEADREEIKQSLRCLEEAHKELKATQNEMIRAEKLASVGRLSAGIAHEIGNPLGIVLGYLSLVRRRPACSSDVETGDYLARAESEISRINQIITQLLDFARAQPRKRRSTSVHHLIMDVGTMLSEQPMMRDIQLIYQLDAEDDRLYLDAEQLRQVLVNLLINAADSISLSERAGKGEIRITTGIEANAVSGAQVQKSALYVSVSDNGVGIAPEDIDNIFDPFYTTKEPGKGTGLGLSVSYMIIEQFGGSIEVNSRVDRGTEMVLHLPRADESENNG